ncbi:MULTISPECIES: hypothetical protein [unclassified Mesorhizobium]|uniref:hypothetical protein n=1 Tax=unclassified Mesorhizobium TaxID=325217 RepID=UPI000FE882A3|nr:MULTISPECIES: hypothetical protein [unclassified Mesorhizobium]RWC25203.1 MAG: hypothetical protein EOS51_00870 [Mesorhizobium sp.]RWD77069.1 MAG: hypothetical protein EOS48_29845 [Mesorhizobium sp.]RWE97023.1 MAG: hypothetical protein EOS68_16315 [Mesorhizobium sp.]RWF55840.1 MAG: hypothetical protein EOS50_12375 [Mesorhizobium sp.]TGT93066.1 hypothetical protein EN807_29620 [Mesorhizobium sp. M5C.F.Ca.ET.164.01.1.1]
MTPAAVARTLEHSTPKPIAALITICTHRKMARAPFAATAVSLRLGPQEVIQTAWNTKMRALPLAASAGALYAGRGFGLATQAANIAEAKLYVLSAGLGLVDINRQVPLYGLTVSGGHAESVAARVTDEFDPGAWFASLMSGAYSDQWGDAFGQGSGRVLIALTRPYAEMVGKSLSELGPQALARLRIFGASLASALPVTLAPSVLPYDDRLDAILPGTRADFSQRAMLHFVRLVATKRDAYDRDADYAAVEAAIGGVAAPDRPRRLRRNDAEIVQLILARLRSQSGIARILRALRDEEGVACEQSRFSRLYRAAMEQRGAA